MVKYFTFILISTLVLFNLHCSNLSQSSHNILRVALFDNPTNLDPRTSSDVASYRVIEQIYDPLIKMDSTGTPCPILATHWDNPSDTVYIFHIRKGVTFHDGQPLSAYDVEFTLKTILDPDLKAPARRSFEIIDKITVYDSLTLKIKLKHPFAPFLSNMEIGIVPRHLVKNNPQVLQRRPLGSGPFILKKWEPDVSLELVANKNYWQGRPKLDGIHIKILPEVTTRILALEYGEVDFLMNNFPLSYLKRFKKNPRLKVKIKPGSNYVYIGLNLRNPYLKHKKVRKAIAHAINIQSIIDHLMLGIYKPAKSLLNPSHWAYHPGLPDYPYDPEKARNLLDEAGFPDPDGDGPQPRFRLNYKCTDKQMSRQKAQIIKQYLEKVGIQIDIQSYEWGAFFDDIQHGRFDMYSLTWVGIYEPNHYDRIFHSHSIGSGANRGGYQNYVVDRLIEEAQCELDQSIRRKKYFRIQEIIADELPYISLWYETNIAVMNKDLYGFEFYPAAEWRSFWKMYFKKNSANR